MKRTTVILFVILSLAPVLAFAQAGTLDATFANNGIGSYSIPFDNDNSDAKFSVIQPDGKIIIGGFVHGGIIYLLRLNDNGTIDNSYGGDGKILFTAPAMDVSFLSGATQADGKLIVACTVANEFMILRFNTNGTPDNSFDSDGKALISVSADFDIATVVKVQTDGKIIVAGKSFIAGGNGIGVARLNSNGSLDNSFDSDGKLVYTISFVYFDQPNAIALKNGKIFIAGYSKNIAGNMDFSVAKLNTDGSFDAGFGTNGKLILPLYENFDDYATDIAINSNNKILLCGYEEFGYGFLAARLNSDGTLDEGFDGDGKTLITFSEDYNRASNMVVQPDNKVLISGRAADAAINYGYAITRLNNNGTPDNSFNGDGKKIVDVSIAGSDLCKGLHLLADNRILLTGQSYFNPSVDVPSFSDYSAVRLNGDGSFDNSFDADGIAVFKAGGISDAANAMAIQPNGFIVTAGASEYNTSRIYLSLSRIKKNGNTDNSFDADGKTILYSLDSYQANGIALQPDGKIVTAGAGNGVADTIFTICRFNADGSTDASFGNFGIMQIDISGYASAANCITLQNDGKIIASGYAKNSTGTASFAVARLNTNGTLDNTFDGDGIKTITPSIIKGSAFAYTIAIQSNGKIVLAGNSMSTSPNAGFDFAAVRINTNGSLDNSFSGDGKLTIPLTGDDYCYASKINSTGNIILGGSSKSNNLNVFSVMMLNSSGALESTFGDAGKKLIQMGRYNDAAKAIALQADGKILLAGNSSNGKDYNAAIVRLTAMGQLDNNFDSDGKVIISLTGSDEVVNAAALQDDGKLLIAGKQKTTSESFSYSIMVMRIQTAAALDIPATTTSKNTITQHVHIPNLLHKHENWQINGAQNNFTVTIANAAGQTIYQSLDYHNNFTASALPIGIYYYTLTAKDAVDRKHIYKGKLMILD